MELELPCGRRSSPARSTAHGSKSTLTRLRPTSPSRLRRPALAEAVGTRRGAAAPTDHRRRAEARRSVTADQSDRDRPLRPDPRRARDRGAEAAYIPPMLSCDEIWCQLFSEPGAGSDLANTATRAERDGDHYVINGHKIWTSLAHYSQLGILLARTDPDAPKHEASPTSSSRWICPGSRSLRSSTSPERTASTRSSSPTSGSRPRT